MPNPSSPLAAVSAQYLQDLEARYLADPLSIDPGWRCVFDVLRDLGAGPPSDGDGAVIADAYRHYGHLAADLDPLGLRARPAPPRGAAPAGLVERLRSTYCGSLATESAHIDDAGLREWIRTALEECPAVHDAAADSHLLERLIAAEEFERFMAVRFTGKKRFGAEGAEALIPLLDRLLRGAAAAGITDILVGNMHRGRLNLLGNVFGKPLDELFAQFKGMHPFGSGSPSAADIPYHFGHDGELLLGDRRLRVTLAPNPSHLEAVNPVLLGRVRARRDMHAEPRRVLGILLHTDASVVGEGVVAEMLQLSGVPGFATGGTVHVVVNNQIGFTTGRDEARTSTHCTGPWKAIDSLILHANADDPPAVVRAADIALEYRNAHARDAVIDLVCYRRNGHNEVDEPRFTQPVMYREIDGHPSVTALYGAKLRAAGTISAADIESLAGRARTRLADAYERAPDVRAPDLPAPIVADEPATGCPAERLHALLTALATVPEGVSVNPKVARLIAQRAQCAQTGIPWAVAEALAFASLLAEGTAVRLSGQDVMRGAFSQRHLSVIDTGTGQHHDLIAALGTNRARFDAYNSPLSEYAVLGFEYGYSVERPGALVVWEAQFGDFSNCAQVLFDQFLSSAEEKWRQQSGLVVLLPHGLEGQGPEHSSGRLERLLQLCAQDNWQVAQPSTPANLFHLLRRQVLRGIRKPLIVMSAKSLLRHPAAVSPADQFGTGSTYRPVIATAVAGAVRHVLVCSGKIAYELEREREIRGCADVAIVRLEMLYPFPDAELGALIARWPDAQYTWVQEEPCNLGPWNFVDRRLEALLSGAGARHARPGCVSRPESASPAGSYHLHHERDQVQLVDAAFARVGTTRTTPDT